MASTDISTAFPTFNASVFLFLLQFKKGLELIFAETFRNGHCLSILGIATILEKQFTSLSRTYEGTIRVFTSMNGWK